jgi:nucleoid-associated protein YgaU
VEEGDTLATISQKFYGDPTMWRRIYDANRSALGDNPDAIKIGTQLRIPPKE